MTATGCSSAWDNAMLVTAAVCPVSGPASGCPRRASILVRCSPIPLALDGVIAGWTEGVQMMVEGEKRRFWIPERLAYGGAPGKPAGLNRS